MPRKVRDKAVDSREARSKLSARGKPYWKSIGKGLHLGYRRLKGAAGTWSTRLYLDNGKYEVELLGTADDQTAADDVSVLDFWQAQEKAQQRFRSQGKSAGPYTVAAALDDYLRNLEAEGRSPLALVDTRARIEKLIRPKLGPIVAATLTAKQVQHWLNNLATTPSLRRGSKPQDDDAQRARRASANRVLNLLKAALNAAHERGDIVDDRAWAVKAFKSVHKARANFLSLDEAKRLTNAASPEFRPIFQAALLTGARYGSLAAVRVRDFNREAGTVGMLSRKGSGAQRVYHVALNPEGISFFEAQCAGRERDDLIFTHNDGSPWKKTDQHYCMVKACKAAGIKPIIGFHQLRHSYASLAIMAGVPLMVVAENLGHSDTKMIMKNYGHLAADYKTQVIREKMPTFGFEQDRKITPYRAVS